MANPESQPAPPTSSEDGSAKTGAGTGSSTSRGAAAGAKPDDAGEHGRLSWREGLFLVGPDPLTSPYYSSGALIAAGVGYATPGFQIGLYLLLFLLAPLYVEAVLLTLSNGGTYVMTRYSLSHLGWVAVIASALVGIIISFSYVATAIVSLLAYGNYVSSLAALGNDGGEGTVALAIALSAIPSLGFGLWVMPREWQQVSVTVLVTSLVALLLSSVMDGNAPVMFAPLVMLFSLNNQGLKESVKVSKTIFLINLLVMGLTIVMGLVYLAMHGADLSVFWNGAELADPVAGVDDGHGDVGGPLSALPGLGMMTAPLVLAGVGSSILGASGVESVMNIPEDLERPKRDVGRIYLWMLMALLLIGGSLSFLLFVVLTPDELAHKSNYLLAALGYRAVAGVTGNTTLANVWQVVIVANAALMLIGATNTGFAGARGLWLTMTRDNLLPRFLLAPNEHGAFQRVHWLMLAAIFGLALMGEWSVEKLERWYGATFGLVMFSGMVAFILLRKFKASDPRAYTAPFNVTLFGVRTPIAAIIGLVVLGYALLSMYSTYRGDIGELQRLVLLVGISVAVVLLLFNHRPIIRWAHQYLRAVLDSVESTVIETEDRTVVVAVGSVRTGRLLQRAIGAARAQSRVTGIPYRQVVVFHMTPQVSQEFVYEVRPDSVRPTSIPPSAVRIFTELTQYAPADMRAYLALVPPPPGDGVAEPESLHQALDALVSFHERHNFRGHMVMVGTYGVARTDLHELGERLEGSTLVPVPLFGDDDD